jgi:hypothetical protein
MGLVANITSPLGLPGTIDNPLVTAFIRPQRAIASFTTQVTIEELHHDEMVITEHPVEWGADITDHAYKKPPEVMIHCGFSNSSIASLITDVQSFGQLFTTGGTLGPTNYAEMIYANFLALQESAQLFSVTTGKRKYDNMLAKSITVHTDVKTENMLAISILCKKVILVQTTLTASINSNGVAPTPVNPAVSLAVQNMGVKSLLSTTNFNFSAYSNITGLVPGL